MSAAEMPLLVTTRDSNNSGEIVVDGEGNIGGDINQCDPVRMMVNLVLRMELYSVATAAPRIGGKLGITRCTGRTYITPILPVTVQLGLINDACGRFSRSYSLLRKDDV